MLFARASDTAVYVVTVKAGGFWNGRFLSVGGGLLCPSPSDVHPEGLADWGFCPGLLSSLFTQCEVLEHCENRTCTWTCCSPENQRVLC